MQSFIVGLLLAGVSANTVLAFKHPAGYARLFPYLVGAATLIFGGVTIWHIAVEISWQGLNEYVAQDSRTDAMAAKEQLSLPYAWTAFSYLGIVAFLWVNLKLPPFLQVAEQSSNGDSED